MFLCVHDVSKFQVNVDIRAISFGVVVTRPEHDFRPIRCNDSLHFLGCIIVDQCHRADIMQHGMGFIHENVGANCHIVSQDSFKVLCSEPSQGLASNLLLQIS